MNMFGGELRFKGVVLFVRICGEVGGFWRRLKLIFRGEWG